MYIFTTGLCYIWLRNLKYSKWSSRSHENYLTSFLDKNSMNIRTTVTEDRMIVRIVLDIIYDGLKMGDIGLWSIVDWRHLTEIFTSYRDLAFFDILNGS